MEENYSSQGIQRVATVFTHPQPKQEGIDTWDKAWITSHPWGWRKLEQLLRTILPYQEVLDAAALLRRVEGETGKKSGLSQGDVITQDPREGMGQIPTVAGGVNTGKGHT